MFHHVLRAPSRSLRCLVVLVAAAAVVMGVVPGHARATADENYAGSDIQGYGTEPGWPVSLDDNLTSGSSGWTCAGAEQGSTFYGHYFCASDYACHVYSGETLTPLAHNHEAYYQYVYGYFWSYPDKNTSQCPHGGTVSAPEMASPEATPAASQFIAPDGRSCLEVADVKGYGVTCKTQAEAAAGKLLGVLESGPGQPSSAVLVAVAPSGASGARLVNENGTSQALSTSGGLVTMPLPAGAKQIVWTTGSGDVVSSLSGAR